MSFTVYKSSAGSGKTYTLVLEYLKLILPEPGRFRNILAITFTNKAANEMKERVLDSLRILSDPKLTETEKAGELAARLMAETGLPKEIIALRAGEALHMILHNYSDFAISTIDSFSHRIMRTFARDLGLSINFLISLESKTLRKTAVDLMLNRAGEDKELTSLLVRFLETMIDETNGWKIENILENFSVVLEDEEISVNLEKIQHLTLDDFSRIIRHFDSLYGQLREILSEPGKKTISLITEKGIPPGAFYHSDSGFYAYMKRIANGNFSNLTEGKYLRETVEEEKWCSAKTPGDEREKILGISGELFQYFEDFRNLKTDRYPQFSFVEMMRKTLYPMGVLNLLGSVFTDFKKQNNIVQIGEFNRRISDVVIREPVPFIYERLGERFRHILIDEFQDTSKMQWQNLLPLMENALAGGTFNLVVGDGKQAIYRWRNGEVDQFVDLPKISGSDMNHILREREQSLGNHFHEEKLDKNFRSGRNIIDFNNIFFSYIKENLQERNKRVFEGHLQMIPAGKDGGYVQIEFFPPKEKEPVIARIREILAHLEEKKYRWKDIAILCRGNTEASEIARFLVGEGIDVVSSESLLLSYSPDVRFMLNCLRFISRPEESFYQAEILIHLFRKNMISTELNKLLSEAQNGGLTSLLAAHGFDLDPRYLSMLPFYDMCEELVRIFRYNESANVYVQFFMDAVLDFTRQSTRGIEGFLEWWQLEEEKRSVVVPEGLNAVNIMTIHKAKGLQFPVVIFPFANQGASRATKKYLWIDIPPENNEGLPAVMLRPEKQMLETAYSPVYEDEMRKTELDLVNLLYVVMTRPKEGLYILSVDPPAEQSVCIPSFFKGYLAVKGEWEETRRVYSFGELRTNSASVEVSDTGKLESFISDRWRKKIAIRANVPAGWSPDDTQDRRGRGTLIHDLLSGITLADDADSVLNDAIKSGRLPAEKAVEISATIHKIIAHPGVSSFFLPGKKVLNEIEILSGGGQAYRPDRIILDNGKAIIIDYKTGKDDEHHHNQLRTYEILLNDLGYADVEKYLLYVEPEIRLNQVF